MTHGLLKPGSVYLAELAEPLYRGSEAAPTSYDLAFASCIILFNYADVELQAQSSSIMGWALIGSMAL